MSLPSTGTPATGNLGPLCCAACLHAIVAPATPVLREGRFFHLDHVPVDGIAAAEPAVA